MKHRQNDFDIIIVFLGLLLFYQFRKKRDWGTPGSCQNPGSTPELALVHIKMKLSTAECNDWDHTWSQQADSESDNGHLLWQNH